MRIIYAYSYYLVYDKAAFNSLFEMPLYHALRALGRNRVRLSILCLRCTKLVVLYNSHIEVLFQFSV